MNLNNLLVTVAVYKSIQKHRVLHYVSTVISILHNAINVKKSF